MTAANLPAPSALARANRISVELPLGIRLTVDADVDPQALARILRVLGP